MDKVVTRAFLCAMMACIGAFIGAALSFHEARTHLMPADYGTESNGAFENRMKGVRDGRYSFSRLETVLRAQQTELAFLRRTLKGVSQALAGFGAAFAIVGSSSLAAALVIAHHSTKPSKGASSVGSRAFRWWVMIAGVGYAGFLAILLIRRERLELDALAVVAAGTALIGIPLSRGASRVAALHICPEGISGSTVFCNRVQLEWNEVDGIRAHRRWIMKHLEISSNKRAAKIVFPMFALDSDALMSAVRQQSGLADTAIGQFADALGRRPPN